MTDPTFAVCSSVAESVQAGDDATAERSLSAALFVGFVMGLAVWALFHVSLQLMFPVV